TQATGTPWSIGNTPLAKISLNAQSGALGGNGGTLFFSTSGNLTVDPNAFLAGPLGAGGNGANLTLIAAGGFGSLLVTGSVSTSAVGTGNGGSLTLQCRDSSTPFAINSLKAINGVQGLISLSGAGGGSDGTLSVTNTTGGVSLLQSLTNVFSATLAANN